MVTVTVQTGQLVRVEGHARSRTTCVAISTVAFLLFGHGGTRAVQRRNPKPSLLTFDAAKDELGRRALATLREIARTFPKDVRIVE